MAVDIRKEESETSKQGRDLRVDAKEKRLINCHQVDVNPVSYTHLTLPTTPYV